MSDRTRIVIALGGNALQSKKSAPTAEAQLEVVRKTCEYIAEISTRGYEMAIVHGNGPQVGRIILSSEAAMKFVRFNPGKRAIISSLDKAVEALEGKTGTIITFA